MITLQEIIQGVEAVFAPLISGVGQLFAFLFNTPTIAGVSIGGWGLFFAVIGIILAGVFRG